MQRSVPENKRLDDPVATCKSLPELDSEAENLLFISTYTYILTWWGVLIISFFFFFVPSKNFSTVVSFVCICAVPGVRFHSTFRLPQGLDGLDGKKQLEAANIGDRRME